MTIEQWLGSDNKLGIDIWHKKYQHNNESFEEWLDRVSNGNEEVRELIKEKKFLFGGRTLSNRGLDTGGSYSNCFIAGTQVLTQEGYKAIEDIQVGEYVLTHDGTYQKVNDVMSRHYKGQGIRFYDSRLYDDIICTPNHKFLTQRGWVEAQEIYQCNKYQSSKNYKLYNVNSFYENDEQIIDLSIMLADIPNLTFDNEKVWIQTGYHRTIPVNRYITIDKTLKYIFGRYLGDGSVTDKKEYKNYIFQIVFNAKTEYQDYLYCRDILNSHFGIECRDNSNEKQNTAVLKISSIIIGTFFERLCGKKENKHFPLDYKNDINIAIGLLDSDGYINKSNSIRIWLKLDILMEDLIECLRNNNIIIRRSIKAPNNDSVINKLDISQAASRKLIPLMRKQKKRGMSKSNQFYINTENGLFINTWDIETVELDEMVYNLSVENNHDYVVQGISVHNCYSSGYVEDDYSSIMQTAVDIGLTFKAQGGQGVSLTKLRPKGTPIKNNYTSDGIIPFMKIYNEVTAGTSQGGSRKGALMISLDIRHAEAANFITVKSQEGVIEKANLSLEIDDEFMEAVEKYYETGEVVTLHEKRDYSGHIVEYDVVPIEIFKLLVDNSYDWGDPACLFTNRFRNYNIMEFDDDYQIETSNP